ncbi:Crp/Fnr family transcriptional regulator [Micromonospora coxensis]|uniref:cAMP-binding domain of CRP or a regulatory subunit of cAMP-dependent protein kinases n=1 Tax=Micromonospora coxensis TaxID=356852 RepID=A0A1C5JBN7_9ACTN|nr:Crp/Fnr family transcriptional regulator [Micromonospora coxensis]SCG67980.1 cAMP-binding domain of CRP or a regulatory subunit of cAMP-dependent protein kinases [Micromonospora coxensis]
MTQARRGGGPTESPPVGTFLANLSPTARDALTRAGRRQVYPAGTALFHQGDPSRHVVLIGEGWVKVTSYSRQGWEALLAIRGPGDILGELSAVDGRPRLATVSGLTRVTATVLTAEQLQDCLTAWPEIALSLLRHLASSLREADNRRVEYGSSNGDSRLVVLLVELLEKHGVPSPEGVVLDLPLTQQDLAASVGTSREVVARTLRVLRQRDVLLTRRRQIVVVQPDLLRSLAGSVSMSTSKP